jgi:hypothetical protein
VDGRIGHLHCRYRVIGARDAAGAVTAHLDHLAQERVAEVWAAALDQALGDDPAVYVLRRVEARLALGMAGGQDDAHLAQRWGERLAGAVVHSIARDPDDGTNLVRFADQADYVAHFVADLLQGRAWNRWFYGAFASLRSHSTPDAMRTVLLDNRDHLLVILSYLHRYGALEKLLAILDEATLRLLWSHGLGAYVGPDAEAMRPLFAGALRLMDRLGLWARARPGSEALFQAYLATGPPPADWRDRRGLAAAVLDILRFLAGQGYLQRFTFERSNVQTFDSALADFDWLDADWLRASLLELLVGSEGWQTELPVRPAGQGPTPRQRELLADLTALLRDGGVRLDRSRPDSPANALRLYALLVARASRWAGDAAVTVMIQRLLAAWALLAQTRSPVEAKRRLRQGDVEGVLRALPEGSRTRAAGTLKFVAALGAPALTLVETLVGAESPVPVMTGRGIETGCAGVFLLLRAILDARLPMLVADTGYPPGLGALLLALGLRWAGEPGVVQGRVDAGLSLWAGLDNPPTFEALQDIWSETKQEDHARFQEALLLTLAGRRLVSGSLLHLYHVPVGSGHTALVAGDGTAGLWPLGRVVETTADVAGIVAGWLEVWERTTGYRPTPVIDDEIDKSVLLTDPEAGVTGKERPTIDRRADPTKGDKSPSVSLLQQALPDQPGDKSPGESRTGQEALLAALEALDHGRLGVPDADLTVAVAAIAFLRVWARWLRQFAASSVPYLLANFIRRPGRVYVDGNGILVEMESRPLDVVIHMAGYTTELERAPWLGQRRVRFQL